MIRLLIVDDDPFIRESLKLIINQDEEIEVLECCTNGQEAYEYFQLHPEVNLVLMDIRMPVWNGVEAARKMKEKNSSLPILFLTTFDDDEYIIEALKLGMNGYLLKNLPPDQIIKGIKMVAEGHMLVHPDVARKLPGFIQQRTNVTKSLHHLGITPTEQQIIECIANGLSNKEIAEHLFLSEGTVKNYVTQILHKLQVRDRTQIAIFYLNMR